MKRNINLSKYEGHSPAPWDISIVTTLSTRNRDCPTRYIAKFYKNSNSKDRILVRDAPDLLAELSRVYALAERMEAWMKDVLVDSLPMSATMERYAKGLHEDGKQLLAEIGGDE